MRIRIIATQSQAIKFNRNETVWDTDIDIESLTEKQRLRLAKSMSYNSPDGVRIENSIFADYLDYTGNVTAEKIQSVIDIEFDTTKKQYDYNFEKVSGAVYEWNKNKKIFNITDEDYHLSNCYNYKKELELEENKLDELKAMYKKCCAEMIEYKKDEYEKRLKKIIDIIEQNNGNTSIPSDDREFINDKRYIVVKNEYGKRRQAFFNEQEKMKKEMEEKRENQKKEMEEKRENQKKMAFDSIIKNYASEIQRQKYESGLMARSEIIRIAKNSIFKDFIEIEYVIDEEKNVSDKKTLTDEEFIKYNDILKKLPKNVHTELLNVYGDDSDTDDSDTDDSDTVLRLNYLYDDIIEICIDLKLN